MNYLDWFKEFYAKYPGVVIGGIAGATLGVSISAFGLWHTLVVLICLGAGLFLGFRVDGGYDVFGLPERIKAMFRRK